MKQIKLKKTETGWAFGRIAIIRRKWELPFSCVSYTAIVDGLKVEVETAVASQLSHTDMMRFESLASTATRSALALTVGSFVLHHEVGAFDKIKGEHASSRPAARNQG